MRAYKVFQLDLLAVRPYLTLKNLIILIGLSILYGLIFKNPISMLAIIQIFAILFSGYPFMVGDEAGIDPLYKLFGIKSKEVVKGRYLTAVFFAGLMLVVGIFFITILSFVRPIKDLFQILLLLVPLIFLVVTVIIFMEYPIYFKYGYTKGRTLATIFLLFLGLLGMLSSFFEEATRQFFRFFILNPAIGLGLLFIFWLLILFLSYRLSNIFYSQRDF